MKTLHQLKAEKVYVDLKHLAEFIDAAGFSPTFPKDDKGRVSLPFAIALICGAQPHHASDDFEYLLRVLPAFGRTRFANCWDAIEAEVDRDIVEWSNSVSTADMCERIISIAMSIELS